MNSLYRLSVFGPSQPSTPTRSHSTSDAKETDSFIEAPSLGKGTSGEEADAPQTPLEKGEEPISIKEEQQDEEANGVSIGEVVNEKTALLGHSRGRSKTLGNGLRKSLKRIGEAFVGTLTVVVSTLAAPVTYIFACFYDDQGRFSALLPLRRISAALARKNSRSTARAIGINAAPAASNYGGSTTEGRSLSYQRRSSRTAISSASAIHASLESDHEQAPAAEPDDDSPSRHTRSKSLASFTSQANGAGRLSIRIQDNPRAQRPRQSDLRKDQPTTDQVTELTPENVKSPLSSVSPASRFDVKYPRAAPIPPRPLVPQRQPSYTASKPSSTKPQKFLVIDLDETLIHSNSSGGKMSTGYNLEVKFSNGAGLSNHPILYTVRKRPYCDEFLKKVSKWYNCVIFTAGLQDYADPVIDLLERERKYFVGRYYRQHCTFRNGAYIKDIAQVEADLSKIMILDNSPMSYIFQPDNAIPIEGWIGDDPHDSNLLHLIPLLEALQHVEDVRAICGLQSGEVISHDVLAQEVNIAREVPLPP